MNIEIRALAAQDAEEFWKLRLVALETEPRAFGSSAEEHRATSVEEFGNRLAASNDSFVLGAFAGGELVGTVGFGRIMRLKERHKGRIWGVFVHEKHRGRGIARAMLMKTLHRARSLAGLEQIVLTVGAHQTAAKQLYLSLGFTIFGHERVALKVADLPVDEDHMVFFL